MGSEYRSRTIRPSVCSELVRAMTSLYAPRPVPRAAGPRIWQPASGSHAARTTMARNRSAGVRTVTIIPTQNRPRQSGVFIGLLSNMNHFFCPASFGVSVARVAQIQTNIDPQEERDTKPVDEETPV